MKISNILCPTDFSELSGAAIEHATKLELQHDATIHFVFVYEPVFADGYIEGMAISPPTAIDLDPFKERLKSIRPTIGLTVKKEIDCRHELTIGSPAGSLLSYAEEFDIDLIVIGTHGRSGASRLIMGSVAEAVVRRAKCPVMSVHAPPEPAEA